jgi:hypothetical protein
MSAYLSFVAHAHSTRGQFAEYLVLVLAVACLPAVAFACLLLAVLGLAGTVLAATAFVACTARDRLAAALYRGRVVLAERLLDVADAIDPRRVPLAALPSWEPDYTCPDCGEVGFDCSCSWSPVEVPAAVPAVPRESTPAVALVVAPEPADAGVALPEVFLPLTGTTDEPGPLPEPLPMPSAARETEPAAPADPAAADERDEADGIRAALAEHGSLRAAARALGMPESTLRTKCKRLGIGTPRGRGKGKGKGTAAA